MSPEVTQKLLAHLSATWRNKPCPMCLGGPWQLQKHAVNMELHEVAGLIAVTPQQLMLPCAAVVCLNCGYTALVNLKVAGIDGSVVTPSESSGG